MDKTDVLDLISEALKASTDKRIVEVSFDGDNKSAEIILTVEEAGIKQAFVIRSNDIDETELDDEDEG